jgi:hypothetical protein
MVSMERRLASTVPGIYREHLAYCYPSENACWSSYSGHITDRTKNKLEKKGIVDIV